MDHREPNVNFEMREIREKIKTIEAYHPIYERSIRDPEGFWAELAEELEWYQKWNKVLEYDYEKPEIHWFQGGRLNVSYNCLDRHLRSWKKNKVALIWQGEPLEEKRMFTFQKLYAHVCRFANVLKKLGVKKGDRVIIYLPMIPELPIAMLACARIGAIHSIIFRGAGSEVLKNRIKDLGSKILITADGCYRNGKIVQYKTIADEALLECSEIEAVIVVRRLGIKIPFKKDRDLWWHEEIAKGDLPSHSDPEIMDAEDPLFILYTGVGKGKPQGAIHTTGGYLLFGCQTLKWVFDVKEEDTFFHTEDISWIHGHSYFIYGLLALGITSLMFEGIPTYPTRDRLWDIIERYRVTILYTSSQVIQEFIEEGAKKRNISSLRLLSSGMKAVPLEIWNQDHVSIDQGRCLIINTWGQIETGGILISSLPIPPHSRPVNLPLPGILLKILKEDGTEGEKGEIGFLSIAKPWPGIIRGFWNDPDRKTFKETYFTTFPNYYFTGEGAKKDEEGCFWIMGRVDDTLHVYGHRIGISEVERALLSHPSVADVAVINLPDKEKEQIIYAFVTLKEAVKNQREMKKVFHDYIMKAIGPIATPIKLRLMGALPKMRSGRLMRKVLREIADEEIVELGDIFLPLNNSLFYHLGHTWVKREGEDEVKIGMDHFIGSMIEGVHVVLLPPPMNQRVRGESLCQIIQDGGILDMVSPVSGWVLSINPRLRDHPELIRQDPYGEGFLLTMKPKDFQNDQKYLIKGEGIISWYQKEWERLKETMISELDYEDQRLGITLQDGRLMSKEIIDLVGAERWIRVLNRFLRDGGSGLPP